MGLFVLGNKKSMDPDVRALAMFFGHYNQIKSYMVCKNPQGRIYLIVSWSNRETYCSLSQIRLLIWLIDGTGGAEVSY